MGRATRLGIEPRRPPGVGMNEGHLEQALARPWHGPKYSAAGLVTR